MEHKGNFDNVEMTEEESNYTIKDENGNIVNPDNKMIRCFHPDYKRYRQQNDN